MAHHEPAAREKRETSQASGQCDLRRERHSVHHRRDSVGPVAARLRERYTIGSFIHILLVIAVVLLLVQFLSGRRVV
jgi:hypothetical protein